MKRAKEFFYFIILMVFLVGSSFAIAEVRMQSVLMGYRIETLNKEKLQLQEQAQRLRSELAQLHSYQSLLQKKQEFNIPLVTPDEWLPLPSNDKKEE